MEKLAVPLPEIRLDGKENIWPPPASRGLSILCSCDGVTPFRITPGSFWLVVPPRPLVSRKTRPDCKRLIELICQPSMTRFRKPMPFDHLRPDPKRSS